MKSFSFNKIILLIMALYLSSCGNENSHRENHAPKAEKIEKKLTAHGHTRIDNYYWLNERENPKVIDYLKAENAYTDSALAHTKDLQKTIFDEIVGRIKKDENSVPYKKNGYFYYTRYEKGMEYPLFCRKKGNLEAPEEIMINGNELAEGHTFFQIRGLSVSEDNQLVAYGSDTVGRRKFNIFCKNLKTGELLNDQLKMTEGYAVWSNDGKSFYYVTKDPETLRSNKIFRHILGTPQEKDQLIYEETDETFTIGIGKSKSKKYLIITSASTLSTESRIALADAKDPEFKIFQKREKDLEYSISHFEDKFYVLTNLDAQNFRVMETPENKTSKENWKELIPHKENILIEDIDIFKNYLVVSQRKDGLSQLHIIDQKNKTSYNLPFEEETFTAWADVNLEFDTDVLRFGYTSMTTPPSIYDFNMKTKEKTLLKQEEILGGYKPDDYESQRLFATAKDGTKIPVSLVYKKEFKPDGNNPLLLYAYGSYGYSLDPSFSISRLSLLDRGCAFAIAHIRGGEEMGRQWYEDGKLLKKKNTFTDFIDCSEFLIQEKYVSPDKLFAMGGSAGGLLMGAVVNMRPDLYKGVVAAVPFVDVITTMLDSSLPLTTMEYDEWGNPNEKEYYDYMLSYSPYDQVKKQDYPNMLVTTGLHDSQVQYFEPAKWVAKLREYKTDNHLLLLQTDMEAGHGGASGRFKRFKDTALEYAFLLDLVGIEK